MYKIENRPLKITPIKEDELGIKKDFVSHIPEKYLATFYRNQENLTVIKSDNENDLAAFNSVAEYNIFKNIIRYLNRPDINTFLYHEFLHMSSTIVGKVYIHSGLSQIRKETKSGIGVGLNEGMTVFLDNYYFEDFHSYREEYSLLSYIVQSLFSVFGESLIKWYFNSDLYSLYCNLCYNMGENSTIDFINSIDKLWESLYNKKNINCITVLQSYRKCLIYVETLFIKIITKKYKEKEITKSEYEEVIEIIHSDITRELKTDKFNIPVLFESELRQIEKKALKKV